MCKIACITKITPETSANAKKFIKVMSKTMSRTDHDGWGYAAIDSTGNLFGERWKNPDHAFAADAIRANANAKAAIDKFKGFLKVKDVPPIQYNNFGELGEGLDSKILKGAILHARTATTPNIMINTHPFVTDNTALIHNGGIHNLDELTLRISTCDSEAILNEYLRVGVGLNINNIGQMAGNLRGTYACGVITKDANEHWIMDVFRDRGANLSAYFIQELDCIVIATPGVNWNSNNYTASAYGPVFMACQQLGFTITEEYEVKTASIVRTDLETGEVLENLDFDSSYKEKPAKKGGKKQNKHNEAHHGRRQASYPTSIYDGDVADRWGTLFGDPTSESHNKGNSEKRKWSDREKDEDLDRMLMHEVRGDADSCSIVGPGRQVGTSVDENKLETAKQVIQEFGGDFRMDEHTGGWHRTAPTGTDDDES